jgi:hypothetical protein
VDNTCVMLRTMSKDKAFKALALFKVIKPTCP